MRNSTRLAISVIVVFKLIWLILFIKMYVYAVNVLSQMMTRFLLKYSYPEIIYQQLFPIYFLIMSRQYQ